MNKNNIIFLSTVTYEKITSENKSWKIPGKVKKHRNEK